MKLLLAATFAFLPTALAMGGVAMCTDQGPCMTLSVEPVANGALNGLNCGGQCVVKVCITYDFNADGCSKDDTESISHVCTHGIDDTPDICLPDHFDPYNADFQKDEPVEDSTVHCVAVAPGETALFVVKDASTDSCGSYSGPLPGGSGLTASCGTWDTSGFTGNGQACGGGTECEWTITVPSDYDCDLDDPKPPSGVGGDPHFTTWAGEKFSFHGACDLVLLHSEEFSDGLGMDIHIRTKHIRQFSYITSAAIRIGDEVLEVTGRNKLYYLNGIANAELPNTISGFKITHKDVGDKQQTFLIHLNKQMLVVKTWKEFVSVKIEHAKHHDFGSSVGLMGSFGTGMHLARDGKTVIHDIDEFGREWQVLSSEPKLFQTIQMPQHPQECAMPPQSTVDRRRLGEATITEEAAAKACGHVSPEDFDFCVYDVLATSDISMAGAY